MTSSASRSSMGKVSFKCFRKEVSSELQSSLESEDIPSSEDSEESESSNEYYDIKVNSGSNQNLIAHISNQEKSMLNF